MDPHLVHARVVAQKVKGKACSDFAKFSTLRATTARTQVFHLTSRSCAREKRYHQCKAFSNSQKANQSKKSLWPGREPAASDASHRWTSERYFVRPKVSEKYHVAEHIQILESGYRARVLLWAFLTAAVLGTGYFYVTDTRSSAHRYISVPLMRLLYSDAEDSHHAGVRLLKYMYRLGLHPRERPAASDPGNVTATMSDLTTETLNQALSNPIGISAGLDKHGEVPSALLELGPGIVEIGGVTPYPQAGNPRPRVWRIPSQDALVNRYGLNSVGADAVVRELRMRVRRFVKMNGLIEQQVLSGEAGVPPGSLEKGKLLAIQIAKQGRTSPQDLDAVVQDYEYCARKLAPYADVLVLNVSSPNTPGLRSLQREEALTRVIKGVVGAAEEAIADLTGDGRIISEVRFSDGHRSSLKRATIQRQRPAVMVKVSPDEDSDAQIAAVCASVYKANAQGVIVANTTMSRPALVTTSSSEFSQPNESSTASPISHLSASVQEASSSTNVTSSPTSSSLAALPTNSFDDMNANKRIVNPSVSLADSVVINQKGGYSGPLTFPRTLSLVQRYRRTLDNLANESSISTSSSISTPSSSSSQRITPSPPTDAPPSTDYNSLPSSSSTSITNLGSTTSSHLAADTSYNTDSISNHTSKTTDNSKSDKENHDSNSNKKSNSSSNSSNRNKNKNRKAIFASGGITTGAQAQQVLDAGADVAMVYTAMVYGGLGTVTRLKREMCDVRAERVATKKEERVV